MSDPAIRQTIAELFSAQGWPAGGTELLRRSLAPRGPEMVLDAPGWLGLGAGQLVLDAGCRDGSYGVALAERYGCRVLGVDLVLPGVPEGGVDAAGRVTLIRGDIEALPIADGACDLVWCRDTLSCLHDCGRAMREFARVLRPNGGVVLYAAFTGDRLEPGDRALLVDGLRNSAASMDQPTVEGAIAAAGFRIARRERVGSEWMEHLLEHDPGYLTDDLLEIARLTRDRERLEAALGPVWYRRTIAFAHWRLQIVLGRLVPLLYALVKG
jgi:SAM-dependent methyltransferase